VTPDGAIDAAQEALLRNDRVFASELCESATRTVIGSDQKLASHLLMLPLNCARVSDRRQDELAAEAQQILEQLGGNDDDVRRCASGKREPPTVLLHCLVTVSSLVKIEILLRPSKGIRGRRWLKD